MEAQYKVGDRIELHPACDLWMAGAKYGEIIEVRSDGYTIRSDYRGRHVRLTLDLVMRKV